MTDTIKANDLVNIHLVRSADKLSEILNSEIIFIKSLIFRGLDNLVRIEIENIVQRSTSSSKKRRLPRLTVVLETNGGYTEVVERISNIFRNHFEEVDFIVPSYAYSAGTVLVLSGNRIYMDYYSVLGPIDPQIEDDQGRFIPGMGYLYKYNDLIERSKENKLTDAELLFLTKQFDPAIMFLIEQSRSHAEELIKKWLPEYKFKDWKLTVTNKNKVTLKMKQERAETIAEILGDVTRWHSHGKGITMKELTSSDIKLMIDDFGKDEELNQQLRQYYDLFIDFCLNNNVQYALHTRYRMINISYRRMQND